MKESGYDIVIFPVKILIVLIPVSYLTGGYKIMIENQGQPPSGPKIKQ